MSLKRPTQKMSKSDADPMSRILITDSADEIRAKIKGAITDSVKGISFDPEKRPGVSNLVGILKHVTDNRESCELIAKEYENTSMRAFKEMVADEVVRMLRGIREKFLYLMEPNNHRLHEEVYKGASRARLKAKSTLRQVREAIGTKSLILPLREEDLEDEDAEAAHSEESIFSKPLRFRYIEASPGPKRTSIEMDEVKDTLANSATSGDKSGGAN